MACTRNVYPNCIVKAQLQYSTFAARFSGLYIHFESYALVISMVNFSRSQGHSISYKQIYTSALLGYLAVIAWSHFWWDFVAYCTRPVSVHLAMVCVGCSFDSFSVFLHSLKQQQKSHENYVFLYPFSSLAISTQNDERKFYTGKLCGLTGMGKSTMEWATLV